MKLINLLVRFLAFVDCVILEAELDNRNLILDLCYDMSLYFEMLESREIVKSQLAQARARYTATFKPGVRFTWKSA